MSYFRQIHTLIWKDEDFLEFKQAEKLLFIYFFSNESTTLSGLYKMPLKVVSFETGLSMRVINAALEKFEKLEKIFYRDGYVFVKKFQYYNRGGANVAIAIKKELDNMPDCEIKGLYMQYIHPNIPYQYPINTPPLSIVKNSKEKKSIVLGENGNLITPNQLYEAIEEHELVTIWMNVTGNMGLPTKTGDADAVINSMRDIESTKKEKTQEYLKPFFKAWKERGYSPMNPSWLDWAKCGKIPDKKAKKYNQIVDEDEEKRLNSEAEEIYKLLQEQEDNK